MFSFNLLIFTGFIIDGHRGQMGSFLQGVKFFLIFSEEKKEENCICAQFLFNHGKNTISFTAISLKCLSDWQQLYFEINLSIQIFTHNSLIHACKHAKAGADHAAE